MYHQHPPSQGSQPFSNGPRPPPRQQPPNQHQTRSAMQVMGFQFPRPTQLPDELESALAIRGARDMDHRQIDHVNRLNPHHTQGPGIGQHGSFSSSPLSLPTENQPGNQQGIDWSSYQPPTKLFAGPPPTTSHQSQQHQGPQQPQSSQIGARLPNWIPSVSESPLTQAQHTHGGSGEGQSLYTPESAGSILASFGLSNEDLEVLSHYPDDQLTPDTLPFILRDIQINKSGKQKTVAPTSSSSFSHSTHDMLLPPSCSSPLAHSQSPEVPSLLTVTQTAGKVIDYGHASRTKDDSSNMETFKREPLSSERTVKMYPALSSSSSASKMDKTERRQVHLEHTESSKHGDSDYRRANSIQRKSSHSPGKQFSPSPKSRDLDRDYRRDRTKQRSSSETRSEASSRRSLSSSCGSKPHISSKKLPTPTMINDFSAVSPKVYPHTCSLCHILCDQEKDWVEHVNTVNHTAACRDLRNRYPDWKPNLPSRSGRYGSRALWDPKDHSPSHSISQSHSHSRSPSPPPRKRRVDGRSYRPQKRPDSPHCHPRHQPDTERRDQFEHPRSGSHSPSHLPRASSSSREYWTARRGRVSAASFSRSAVKRPNKYSTDKSRDLSASTGGHRSKHGSSRPSAKTLKSVPKPGTKTAKMSAKPPPPKKKKKMVTPPSQDSSVADRLVYLTGIPEDASEQEVTDLVGSFGKINNVILMPSCEESEKGQGQKASVCMLKPEDAQALASSTDLSIRDQQITAAVAKRPEGEQCPDPSGSRPSVGHGKGAADKDTEGDANQKTSNEKGRLLITGLPESGWSECDIINLIQPFGTPSDIILATQMGRVLVSVADMEVAQEIVKVHTFMPAKIKDFEVKLILLKQHISLSTPVALYNLLMGSVDPLERRAPVGWNSLLVISNVPNTPYGSSEVQKLVRRFGTVIRTLVLSNMVICEMATAAMALSVYKRFQTFPCVIQSNPLFFSRKPDPKASAQTKVIAAYHDSSEDAHGNGKGGQTAAAAADGVEAAESPVDTLEKDHDDDDVKTRKETAEDEVLEGKECKEDNMEKDKLTVCEASAPPENKLEADSVETSGVDTVSKKTEESKAAASEQTPAAEEPKPHSLDGKAAPQETTRTQLPKVTQAMVNALLVECRTRTTSQSNNSAAPPSGEEGKEQTETELGQKTAEETKELSKSNTVEEGEVKRQEKKEKEARKEKEVRERRERERRAWEKEERAKRERERSEKSRRERERRGEERREWERRERERRERKRVHGDTSSGSRSSFRSEGSRQSHRRDEQHSVEAETKREEEELNEFPFDMSDFVTVDEVGDVADLLTNPSEGGGNLPTSVQQHTPESAPMEVTAALEKPAELASECEHVTEMTDVTADLVPSATVSPSTTLQSDPAPSQTHVPASTSKPPEPDITPQPDTSLTAESTPEESIPICVPAASAAPSSSAAVVSAERSQDENEENPLKHGQSSEENAGLIKQEKQREVQDEENKERSDRAAETALSVTGKQEESENSTSAEEKTKSISRTTARSLPPFDPSNPVGMEFLVPKTGFFCKVCSRFFSGSKEAEISHCKTRKHYENLQNYLKTSETTSGTTKPDSS
ncbi:zinc finger protein 638-like [Archocentrus centrarchus]|uniref:zinc finger protein 638-like n=1 Tax=Archocentrus centrarchus TaxID=63155 RepID=UPI0011E9EF70|nr:zinc finger protein 638-like [Archocentrus centrarchus]